MNEINPESVFILDLFNLQAKDVRSIGYFQRDHQSFFQITLEPKLDPCPDCHFEHPKIKNYVLKKISHALFSNRNCTIQYRARRYVCPLCHRTYYEHNPFVFQSMKISTLTIMNCLRDLKDFNETFTSVARRYHISPTSVCSIFDSHVQVSRKPLPKVINFDEVYAFRSKESKYVCVLLDFVKQVPIDLLPQRRFNYLSDYFSKIPLEERKKVKLVCSDMYDVYRTISKKYFPNCVCSVDRFHVSQEFHRKMNAVRIRVMNGLGSKHKNYYILKKFNWLLFKDPLAKDRNGQPLFDIHADRRYNQHYKRFMNYYDLREELLKTNTELNEAYELKLEFNRFYKENTYQTAQNALHQLIARFINSHLDEMHLFGKTLIKWQQEIINSFLSVYHEYKVNKDDGTVAVLDRKISNSIIENRNKVIKCIKHNANGYTNWDRFRNRVMYVLDPNENFHLEPIEKDKDGGSKP